MYVHVPYDFCETLIFIPVINSEVDSVYLGGLVRFRLNCSRYHYASCCPVVYVFLVYTPWQKPLNELCVYACKDGHLYTHNTSHHICTYGSISDHTPPVCTALLLYTGHRMYDLYGTQCIL